MTAPTTQPVLALKDLSAGYGATEVIRDINLEVHAGEVVALLGANGAGKTTTILTMAGELIPQTGEVLWDGVPVTTPLEKRAREGLRLITEERSVFMSLTVADNLRLAHRDFEPCLDLFPELRPLLGRKAGLLSGGEQQMLSLGRALVGNCRVLLADELSLGLAPIATERLLSAVRAAAERGVAVVLVEQQLERALQVADRGYVFRRGRVVLEGDAARLAYQREAVETSYLSDRAAR
jgi:branched-chain amino acid transport system ATP-binding protein